MGPEPGPEEAQETKDPAFSIAAPARRIIGLIEQNALEMGMFGRIVVLDVGLDQEGRAAFIDDANLILSRAPNKTIEALFFTDSKDLPPNYPASAITKQWRGPAERGPSQRPEPPAWRERPAADRQKERHMLTQTEGKPSLEEMGQKIKKILEEVEVYPHPEELDELKKLIQKNIPLGRRTYFAAYLLLQSAQERQAPARAPQGRTSSRRPLSAGPAERRGDRYERPERPERPERQDDRSSYRKPERKIANGVNFYINVGFHDHMNPKALAAFIAESCGIRPEDVCDINLKPTFAFFTVRAELADGISEGLTGKTVGKKTVKANPADQKPPRQPRPRQSAPAARTAEAPVAERPSEPEPQAAAMEPAPAIEPQSEPQAAVQSEVQVQSEAHAEAQAEPQAEAPAAVQDEERPEAANVQE